MDFVAAAANLRAAAYGIPRLSLFDAKVCRVLRSLQCTAETLGRFRLEVSALRRKMRPA